MPVLLEPEQTADDRRRAGFGLGIDLERHFVVAHVRDIGCTASKTYLGSGQIEEARYGAGVIDLELVAFATAIGPLDHQSAVFACQDLGELNHRCARIKHRYTICTLKPERSGGTLAHLLRAQLHLSPIAGDLVSDDLTLFDLAAFGTHCDRAASDGFVFARLEIAENKDIARSE